MAVSKKRAIFSIITIIILTNAPLMSNVELNQVDGIPGGLEFATVSGVVTDTSGNPLEGATVDVDVGNVGSDTTDANGEYSITIDGVTGAAGTIRASKGGYVAIERSFSMNPGNTYTENFALTASSSPFPLSTVEGTVTDVDTGAPLSDVDIKLEGSSISVETTTDNNGYYKITVDVLSDETVTLTASKAVYESESVSFTIVGNNDYTYNFALDSLLIFSRLFGRVTDTDTSAPIPNADVHITGGGYDVTDTTDSNGYYDVTIDILHDTTVTVEVTKLLFDSVSTSLTLVQDSEREENFQMSLDSEFHDLARVFGWVEKPDGSAYEGASINIVGNSIDVSTETDVNGFYEIFIDIIGVSSLSVSITLRAFDLQTKIESTTLTSGDSHRQDFLASDLVCNLDTAYLYRDFTMEYRLPTNGNGQIDLGIDFFKRIFGYEEDTNVPDYLARSYAIAGSYADLYLKFPDTFWWTGIAAYVAAEVASFRTVFWHISENIDLWDAGAIDVFTLKDIILTGEPWMNEIDALMLASAAVATLNLALDIDIFKDNLPAVLAEIEDAFNEIQDLGIYQDIVWQHMLYEERGIECLRSALYEVEADTGDDYSSMRDAFNAIHEVETDSSLSHSERDDLLTSASKNMAFFEQDIVAERTYSAKPYLSLLTPIVHSSFGRYTGSNVKGGIDFIYTDEQWDWVLQNPSLYANMGIDYLAGGGGLTGLILTILDFPDTARSMGMFRSFPLDMFVKNVQEGILNPEDIDFSNPFGDILAQIVAELGDINIADPAQRVSYANDFLLPTFKLLAKQNPSNDRMIQNIRDRGIAFGGNYDQRVDSISPETLRTQNNDPEAAFIIEADLRSPEIESTPSDVTIEYNTYGHVLSWTATDANPWSYDIFLNGELFSSGGWDSDEPILTGIDGLPLGTHTIEIIMYDDFNNDASDSVTVTVIDETAPTLYPEATALTIDAGTDGTFSWRAVDSLPDSYTIYLDGDLIDFGSWANNETKDIILSGLSVGTYELVIEVSDSSGNTASETIIVEVLDTVAPIFNTVPEDLTIEHGSTGYSFTWTFSDDFPDNLTIYRNDVALVNTLWGSPAESTLFFDEYDVGVYNFTFVIQDQSGNIAVDQAFLTVVDTTPPEILVVSEDVTIEAGSVGNIIYFDLNDPHPWEYFIYLDGELIDSFRWRADVDIELVLDDLSLDPGSYEIFIEVTDVYDNSASKLINLSVVDTTMPEISGDTSDIFLEAGDLGYSISLELSDLYPSTYSIFLNERLDVVTTWESGDVVDYNLDHLSLSPGLHNFTILVFDTSGNTNLRTIFVSILDTTSPFVTSSVDSLVLELGYSPFDIEWSASDLFPDTYVISLDGVEQASSSWDSENAIVYQLSSLDLGSYELSITISDQYNNEFSQIIEITVVDTTAPSVLSETSDLSFPVGTTGNDVEISVFDLRPADYTVLLNDTFHEDGMWDNDNNITINFDSLSVGYYEVSVIIYDTSGNSVEVNFNVEVTVVEAQVDVDPNTLNTKSKGKWITVYITLPEPYSVHDIYIESISLNNVIFAEWGNVEDDQTLMVKFDRQAVIDYVDSLGDVNELHIIIKGYALDGSFAFEGEDTITIFNKES